MNWVVATRANDRWPCVTCDNFLMFSLWSRQDEVVATDGSGLVRHDPPAPGQTAPADRWMAVRITPSAQNLIQARIGNFQIGIEFDSLLEIVEGFVFLALGRECKPALVIIRRTDEFVLAGRVFFVGYAPNLSFGTCRHGEQKHGKNGVGGVSHHCGPRLARRPRRWLTKAREKWSKSYAILQP